MTLLAEAAWWSVLASMPHRGTALLLTGIERSEPELIEAVAMIPASYPLVDDAGAPSFLGLELGAQAAAAMAALSEPEEGGGALSRAGYLVRVREASFLAAHLPIDTPLSVTARLEGTALPLTIHRITGACGDLVLVRALLGLHRGAR
jgi:predicted hotdog family 3-hydroxylacyl-ACP dehydratase